MWKAITPNNGDPDPWHHIVSQGHNEFIIAQQVDESGMFVMH